ncbi:MAG: hypothetical protein RBT55_00410 [Rhodocyclaceae bacterium]|jgi:hypothetical protein|nr:hypothetical protein [Rhodocyclaceae bacterium]
MLIKNGRKKDTMTLSRLGWPGSMTSRCPDSKKATPQDGFFA